MNIAIVGSNGYIAGYLKEKLVKEGHMLLKIDKEGEDVHVLDLKCPEKFEYFVLESVDLIVFTAAVSSPDKCAEEYDACWKINVEGTKYFIREATSRGCRVLFFSSDAVYGDIPGYIYTEDSELKGDTAYGRMKRTVEEEFRDNSYFKSIRLSYVMSAEDRFISYCLNCIRKEVTAEIYHPFYRNVVSISDVADVVLWFAGHFDRYKPKALNVAGRELVSRVRMADELNRIFNNRLSYTITMPKANFFANRPMITEMKSLYLNEYGILKDERFATKMQKEMEDILI